MNAVVKKPSKKSAYSRVLNAPALKISDIERNKHAEVWAVNVAPNPSRVLVMVGGKDNPSVVALAETWIPQELTAQATVDRILSSDEMRLAVNGNPVAGKAPLIKLIDAELAQEILASEEAKAELEEIQLRNREIEDARSTKPKLQQATPAKLKPSARVMQAITRSLSGTYTERNMLTFLKGQREVLSRDDLTYIAQEDKNEAVKQLAAKILNSRFGEKRKIKKVKKVKKDAA